MIKIALVEKQILLREVMVSRLSEVENFKIVIETPNEDDLLALLRHKTTNIVVIRPDTSDKTTLNICKLALEAHPKLSILLLTNTFSSDTVAKAFHAGVQGFLNKNCSGQQLQEAIVQLHENGFYLEQEHLEHIKTSVPIVPRTDSEVMASLRTITPREKEVLMKSALGFSIKKIAATFNISSNTVKSHRYQLTQKTGCSNITEVVTLAIKHKFIKAKDIGLKCFLGAWLLLSMSFSFMEGIGSNEVESDSEVMEICWGME